MARVPTQFQQFRRLSALVTRSVAWTVLPMAVVLSYSGESVIRLLYGPRWLSALPLLPWTVWLGASVGIVQTCYFLLLAHQQQRHCFIADVIRLGGTLAALLLALPFGLTAYLSALLVLHAAVGTTSLFWLSSHGAMSAKSLVATFVPPAAGSVLSLVVANQAARWLGPLPQPWTGLVFGAAFCVAYLVFLRVCCSAWMHELILYMPQRHRISVLLRLPVPA